VGLVGIRSKEEEMKFTKQDAITFGWGLVGAFSPVLVASFSSFESATDKKTWAISLMSGLVTAAGRYAYTRFIQKPSA
jgi:hypothetical protein